MQHMEMTDSGVGFDSTDKVELYAFDKEVLPEKSIEVGLPTGGRMETILELSAKDASTSKARLEVLHVSDDDSDKEGGEDERSKQLLDTEDLAVIDEGYLRYQSYLTSLTKGDSLIDVPIGKYIADMFMIPSEVDRLSDFSLGEYLSRTLTACASISSISRVYVSYLCFRYALKNDVLIAASNRSSNGEKCLQTT
ncbi:hypothetical protein M5689_011281 [Euphorbia peplus]|nr:hypothetical protein M5689_011281 [Euphorbia peplus]